MTTSKGEETMKGHKSNKAVAFEAHAKRVMAARNTPRRHEITIPEMYAVMLLVRRGILKFEYRP